MRCRALTFAAALSLLLFAATAILSAHSYRTLTSASQADHFDFTRADPYYWIISNPGRLTLCGQTGHDWNSPTPVVSFLSLEFARSRVGTSFLWNLLIPYWMLAVVTLILPFARARSALRANTRRRRTLRHLCPTCAYNLTANTTGICPECGTAIPSP